jgi:hypothetical protein
LHGLPWGVGGANYLSFARNAIWLVVRVSDTPDNYRAGSGDLTDKCKFRAGEVVFAGDRTDAIGFLDAHGAADKPVVFATRIVGDYGTATAGDRGTATAGNDETAAAGYRGTATAGDYGTATAGNYGTATAGNYGTIQIRYWDGGRYRIATGYIGEDGLLPDVAYRLDGNHEFVH